MNYPCDQTPQNLRLGLNYTDAAQPNTRETGP